MEGERGREREEREGALHSRFPCNYFLVRLFGFNSTLLSPLLRGAVVARFRGKMKTAAATLLRCVERKFRYGAGGWKVNFHRWVVTEGNWRGGRGVEIASTGEGTKFRRNVLRHHQIIESTRIDYYYEILYVADSRNDCADSNRYFISGDEEENIRSSDKHPIFKISSLQLNLCLSFFFFF